MRRRQDDRLEERAQERGADRQDDDKREEEPDHRAQTSAARPLFPTTKEPCSGAGLEGYVWAHGRAQAHAPAGTSTRRTGRSWSTSRAGRCPCSTGASSRSTGPCRRAAGLFDVSHMGEVDVEGPGAGAFLNALVTNDVGKMYPGRVLYSPMCHPDGGVIDDLLVYMRGPGRLLPVHQRRQHARRTSSGSAAQGGRLRRGRDGPLGRSARSSRSRARRRGRHRAVAHGERSSAPLKYYHFAEGAVAGVRCIVSRTGYTGEDGFELYHAAGRGARARGGAPRGRAAPEGSSSAASARATA